MTISKIVPLIYYLFLACCTHGIREPARHIAYRVSPNGDHWLWTFDVCGAHRRPGTRIMNIAVIHHGVNEEPLCSTPTNKLYPNIWQHGDGLLARDGSLCQLGAGKYVIMVTPDWKGTEFEITPNGDMRVLGEQCFVPNDK